MLKGGMLSNKNFKTGNNYKVPNFLIINNNKFWIIKKKLIVNNQEIIVKI